MRLLLLAGIVALMAAACATEPIIEKTLPPPDISVEVIAAAPPISTLTPIPTATVTPTPSITPTATETPYVSSLPNLGRAPELENEVWLNTDQPLRLADLRGQVVLLDMWTFD